MKRAATLLLASLALLVVCLSISLLSPRRAGAEVDGNNDAFVNVSPHTGTANSEVCVTNIAGGTSFTVPAKARTVEFQNNGPNAVHCTLDAQAPTSALGHRIAGLAAGATSIADSWAVDVTPGASAAAKCLADTALQVSGGCVQVTVLK